MLNHLDTSCMCWDVKQIDSNCKIHIVWSIMFNEVVCITPCCLYLHYVSDMQFHACPAPNESSAEGIPRQCLNNLSFWLDMCYWDHLHNCVIIARMKDLIISFQAWSLEKNSHPACGAMAFEAWHQDRWASRKNPVFHFGSTLYPYHIPGQG